MNGRLKVVELKTRKTTFVIASKVAAVMELRHDGPARLIFDGGGELDVCGSAQHWVLMTQLETAAAQVK